MRQLNEKDVALLHMNIQQGYLEEAARNLNADLEISLALLEELVKEERELSPQAEARRAGRLSYYFGVHQRFYIECAAKGLYTTVEEKAQFREQMFKEEDQLLYDYRASWMSAFNG